MVIGQNESSVVSIRYCLGHGVPVSLSLIAALEAKLVLISTEENSNKTRMLKRF